MALGPYQTNAQSRTAALSPGNPEAFGAAVGRGLSDLGEAADRILEREQQRKRDEEAAAAGLELARASSELDRAAIDARESAGPGGAGHSKSIDQLLDERAKAALGNIKDERIRTVFEGKYAELRGTIGDREYAWEGAKRVEKLILDVDEQGTIYANGQASDPTAAGLERSLAFNGSAIDTLEGISDDGKRKLKREQGRKIAVAWGNAMQVKDPASLAEVLNKGLLNQYLEPEDINSLRDGALVEVRRKEAAEKARLAVEEATARERIQLIGKRIAAGDISVTDEEFAAAEADVQKFGLANQGFDLGVWKDKRTVLKETRDWTPAQWSSAIDGLEAKGDKRTAGENVRLAHLKSARPASEARFNSDPFAAAAAAGNPAPKVDWANPSAADFSARVTWAIGRAKATGSPVRFLDNEELAAFRARIDQGAAGQLEVAASLRGLAGAGRGTAIAKEIAPDNRDLQLMVGLPARTGEWYKKGVDGLKRNDKLYNKDAAQELFAQYAPGIPAEMRQSVFNAARAIAAGMAEERNLGDITDEREYERFFRAGLHRAAGALGSSTEGSITGGFGNWNDRFVWLPPRMARNDFARRVTAADGAKWGAAGVSRDGTAAIGKPHYRAGDGRLVPLNDEQIKRMKDYQLETVTPGIYRPIAPDGGTLVDKNGQPWQFSIEKLR